MDRRRFLACSVTAAASTVGSPGGSLNRAQTGADPVGRDFYELRRYELRSGPQRELTDRFLQNAFIPAVNRVGVAPVGVFNIVIGQEIPSMYVLLAGSSLMTLATLEAKLASDAAYQDAGTDFLNAPARAPAYVRMESKLMIAFEGSPRIQVPPATAAHQPRTFELRTYESPSDHDHRRKIEMFHHGEFDIFVQAGFQPVFYGDTLIGTRLPNLTYMLAFGSLDERTNLWNAFTSSPAWKQLSTAQRYAFEPIVTNITNVILSPADYSQI
jgi:hypothetical protein